MASDRVEGEACAVLEGEDMRLAFVLAVLGFAWPAAACPSIGDRWPETGVLEYAGCSTDPTVFELHHAFNAPEPAIPPWNVGEWGTYYTRPDGHYEVVGWFDDAPAVDECGEESWHGRGGEAIPVVCGETWGVRSFPLCDSAVSGDELCPNGWYFLEPDVFHLSVRMLPDADVNRDGVVGSADALRVIRCFGAPAQCDPEADTNRDGVIGTPDWLAVRRNFGRRVESFQHLGHVQRFYSDLAPCRAGERCYGYGDVHVWVEEQR